MRVRVYRNLTASKKKKTPVYSVLYKGRVINHVQGIILGDVKFIVRESGRQRVLREKRKNVHAFVEGEWLRNTKRFGKFFAGPVHYNPYKAPTFILETTGKPIFEARGAVIGRFGVFATVSIATK